MISSLRNRLIVALIVLGLFSSIASGIAPRTAHAQLVVDDPRGSVIAGFNLIENAFSAVKSAAVYTKDYVFDTLAWQALEVARQSIIKSTINWINSGFQGSPAFVTDLKSNLRGVEDAVARRFFQELADQQIAQTPFQDKILNAVRLGYYLSTSPESYYVRYPYTLHEVSPDDRAFLEGDFSQGGWNAWFATVMNPQNNPYGAQMAAEQVLSDTIGTEVQLHTRELEWNKGFLSWRGECTSFGENQFDRDEITTSIPSATRNPDGTLNVTTNTQTQAVATLSEEENCLGYEVRTPGSVIHEQLNKTLGSNVDKLVTADELNEIISALMNQLVGHVLGAGDGGGLRGVSRPSTGGGASYIDRAAREVQEDESLRVTFATSINDHKRNLNEYRAAWSKIGSAAEEAKERCDRSPTPLSTARPRHW